MFYGDFRENHLSGEVLRVFAANVIIDCYGQ